MENTTKRNWAEYNQRLKGQARLDLYVCEEVFCAYEGPRQAGGVQLYKDVLIEACLLVRAYFSLALRQTQGFMGSVAAKIGQNLAVPDYTTLSRRSRTCKVDIALRAKAGGGGYVIAIDSTGLSLMTGDSWNRYKHRSKTGNYAWHKLHVAIDTATGDILACEDTPATTNDCEVLPKLIRDLSQKELVAVCADMAYDTVDCRQAIFAATAQQRIPPKSTAVPTAELKNPKDPSVVRALAPRDEALYYFRANSVNGDDRLARKRWKELIGYHRRSLVETTMSRLKAHAGSTLKAKRDDTKATECRIKCKLLNILNAA